MNGCMIGDAPMNRRRSIGYDDVQNLLKTLADGSPADLDGLSRFVAFWFELLARNPMPQRRHFAPDETIYILPDLWMVDAHSENKLQVRLAGTRMSAAFPVDPTGLSLDHPSAPSRFAPIKSCTTEILQHRSPIAIHSATPVHGQEVWQYQGVAMPMFNDNGQVAIVLGAGQFRSTDPGGINAELIHKTFEIKDLGSPPAL